MEDDRDQLAVILAGYEKEMESLIRSNPGLSSRVNTTIVFEDYSPTDLGKIFEVLCNQNQYELLGEARYLLLVDSATSTKNVIDTSETDAWLVTRLKIA